MTVTEVVRQKPNELNAYHIELNYNFQLSSGFDDGLTVFFFAVDFAMHMTDLRSLFSIAIGKIVYCSIENVQWEHFRWTLSNGNQCQCNPVTGYCAQQSIYALKGSFLPCFQRIDIFIINQKTTSLSFVSWYVRHISMFE